MTWFLVRFEQFDKVLWVTKPTLPNYWATVRGNFFLRNPQDLILGVVVTEATKDLLGHKKDILRGLTA